MIIIKCRSRRMNELTSRAHFLSVHSGISLTSICLGEVSEGRRSGFPSQTHIFLWKSLCLILFLVFTSILHRPYLILTPILLHQQQVARRSSTQNKSAFF